MHIKIFGAPTSGNKMIRTLMDDILHKAKIPCEISEVQDIAYFLEKNIESIPAIQMDDDAIIGLKSNGSFNQSLREAINHILSVQNYGELQKFIIPIDFSDKSINALSYGHRLATDLGAVTKVIHVYNSQVESNFCCGKLDTEEDTKQRLTRLVKSIDHDWGSDILKASFISPEFKTGPISNNILKSAEENNSELIIMSSKNQNSNSFKHHGSISFDIIDKSNCPTLVIPPEANYKGLNKVLLAVGYGKINTAAINTFKNIYQRLDSEVHILQSKKNPNYDDNLRMVTENLPALNILPTLLKDENFISEIGEYAERNQIDSIALSPPMKTESSSILKKMTLRAVNVNNSIPVLLLK